VSLKKEWMMKQMLKGDGAMLCLLISLIYMKKSGSVLMNLVCHSNIEHTFAPNIVINCLMNVIAKKNKYKNIEKK
jgi:hypothetical protein